MSFYSISKNIMTSTNQKYFYLKVTSPWRTKKSKVMWINKGLRDHLLCKKTKCQHTLIPNHNFLSPSLLQPHQTLLFLHLLHCADISVDYSSWWQSVKRRENAKWSICQCWWQISSLSSLLGILKKLLTYYYF